MNTPFTRFLQCLITVLLPTLLVLASVQLLNTNEYLAFEYGKANFPADLFGLDGSQRLAYAGVNFRYVRDNQPIDALAKLRLGDQSIYNARELKHMQDVQKAYRIAVRAWHFALEIFLLAGLVLAWNVETRPALLAAIQAGGMLAAGLVAVIGVLALIAWRAWFIAFHQVFFAPGTWIFNTSDILIRLFPEKFWFDAVLTVAGLTFFGGLLLAFVGWYCKTRSVNRY